MPKYQHKLNQTDQKISNALLSLITAKPFAKVSTDQICKTADINRSTFYHHFADKYLVLEKIEADLLSKFFSISNKRIEKSFSIDELAENLENYIDVLLDIILENRSKLAIILSKNGDPSFHNQLAEMLSTKIKNTWKKISRNGSENFNNLNTDLAIDFIVASDMAIIIYAVEHPAIPHQMIKNTFAQLLIDGPMNTVYKSLMKK